MEERPSASHAAVGVVDQLGCRAGLGVGLRMDAHGFAGFVVGQPRWWCAWLMPAWRCVWCDCGRARTMVRSWRSCGSTRSSCAPSTSHSRPRCASDVSSDRPAVTLMHCICWPLLWGCSNLSWGRVKRPGGAASHAAVHQPAASRPWGVAVCILHARGTCTGSARREFSILGWAREEIQASNRFV
jgi:hypothetical protein